MLRNKGFFAVLVFLAVLALLPACEMLDRKAESPVGVTTEETDVSNRDGPGFKDSGEEREIQKAMPSMCFLLNVPWMAQMPPKNNDDTDLIAMIY